MWFRQHRSTMIAALGVAIIVGYVVAESWSGRAVTFDSILATLVVGVTLGSIYAVAASGLVVTYTTSGIFNFAQGAMGMFCAFVYWQLKVDWGVPTIPALAISVLVFAPLLGAAIERLLMRRLTTAPLVAKLVVTIGLMVALMGLAVSIWDPNTSRVFPQLFPTTQGFTVGETFVPWFRFATIVTGVVLAIVIRLVLHRTRLGVAMRAVVDHRDLAALNGARPGRTSMFAWALGTSMAAIAGIFLAEEITNLSVDTLTLFIVDAFAAAIIGRLRSLPLTYLGGLIIGLSIAFQQNFLIWSERWSSASFAIPTMILLLALLFVPQARIEGRQITSKITPRVPSMKRAAVGMLALFLFILVMAATWDRIGNRNLTLVMLYAFIMLSLVPLTGWSGQISLGQVVFVGVGAFVFAQGGAWTPFGHLTDFNGNPLGLLVAAVCAVPFGLLIALPAVRLQGLYLALATMAFARMAEFIVFDQPEVFGSGAKRIAPIKLFGFGLDEPFTLLGIHFSEDAAMLLFVTALFCIVGLGVVAMRRGRFGRRLVAMRDSPAACATLGVNLFWTKVAVFAISAAIAGFAGALNGAYLGSGSTPDFQMLKGLPLLILLVVGGVAVVSGAVFGAFAFQSFAWLVQLFPAATYPSLNKWLVYWQRIGPGLAGIGIGRNPDGAVVEISAAVHGDRKRKPALPPPPESGDALGVLHPVPEPASPAPVSGGEA
jgi:branched-chain amino acid transport system permease protein